jgi:3-methylfumaryl-CoA hydratase
MSAVAAALVLDGATVTTDVCALPLVRRLSATLDIDPTQWKEGDSLPRGWHLALFSIDTQQSNMPSDGFAGLGVPLPDLGLPRVVFGGRRIQFHDDIPIGAHVLRQTQLTSVSPKEGRSGRFAIATVEHTIFVSGARTPALTEVQDYIMREAASPGTAPPTNNRDGRPDPMPSSARQVTVVPDELLLFRISAVMFNPHRIHYDLPYAVGKEAYPALVVNGSVSSLLLLEFYRRESGKSPDFVNLRNGGLAFCGEPLRLNAIEEGRTWRTWVDNTQGGIVVEGTMGVDRG